MAEAAAMVVRPSSVGRVRAARLAAAVCFAAGTAIPALAQQRPLIRHSAEDGSGITLDQPVGSPIWDTLDNQRSPDRPDLGSTELIAERVVYDLVEAIESGRLEDAQTHADALVALAADRPAAHYNRACVLALRGKPDEAFAALSRAIDFGWRHAAHMSVDLSLNPIRSDARFAAIMSRLAALAEQDRIVPAELRADDWRAIRDELQRESGAILRAHHVPGAVVALVHDGRPVWTGAFGVTDERTDDPLDANTVFRAEAPARLLTAILALKLQERERWSIDDPASKWLPDLAFCSGDAAASLTIRRLLNFTGGVTLTRADVGVIPIDEEIDRTLAVNAARLGTKYTFTPQSYLAVGRAIENALTPLDTEIAPTEEPVGLYHPILKGWLISPLGLSRTLPNQPTRRHLLATGHTEYGTPYRPDVNPLKPASPMHATADDLAKVIAFVLGSRVGVDPEVALEPESIRALYERGIDDSTIQHHYGLGVRVIDTPGGLCAEAASIERGVGALLRWYPDAKRGIVVLFNSDTGLDAARRLAHLALGGA